MVKLKNKEINKELETLVEKVGTYADNEDYETALIYQKKISQIDPDNIGELENLAAIYLKLKRYSDVFEIIEKLPEDCWMRYLIKGHYHDKLNQKEDALKNYLKAHELEPNNRQPLFNLAFHYQHEGEHEKAFEYTFKMLDIDVNDIGALAILTGLYFDTGQFKEVIIYANKAIALSDEKDELIYPPLSFSYLMTGESEKGWDCLVEAIFKHPDEVYYYTLLATYAFAINDDKKAFEIYNVAMKKDPTCPEVHLGLAMHYKSEGDLKTARKYYDKYVELEDEEIVIGFDEF